MLTKWVRSYTMLRRSHDPDPSESIEYHTCAVESQSWYVFFSSCLVCVLLTPNTFRYVVYGLHLRVVATGRWVQCGCLQSLPKQFGMDANNFMRPFAVVPIIVGFPSRFCVCLCVCGRTPGEALMDLSALTDCKGSLPVVRAPVGKPSSAYARL